MSEILSQDQIDELLNAGVATANASSDVMHPSEGAGLASGSRSLEKALGIFCAQTSTVISTVLNKKVAARLSTCAKADTGVMKDGPAGESLCISLPFKTGLKGEMYLIVTKKDTAVLGDLMMMGEGTADYSPEHNDAITELSNQLFSSFSMALGAEIGISVSSAPSKITSNTLDSLPAPPESLDMGIITLSIDGREDSTLAVLVPGIVGGQFDEHNLAGDDAGEGAGNEQALATDGFNAGMNFSSSPEESPSGGGQPPARNKENIEMLLDVDLDVGIELGRSNLSIKRILELAPGSIVELDRMAGEPVDLMVNSKVVAKGEVIVIDESFGIRIISLISPEERIKSLR